MRISHPLQEDAIALSVSLGTGGGGGLLDGGLAEAGDGALGHGVGLYNDGRDLGVAAGRGDQCVKACTDQGKGRAGVQGEEVAEAEEVGVDDGREERGLEGDRAEDQGAHDTNDLDI